MLALTWAGVVTAQALPTHGSIKAGQGSIHQSGNHLTVTQTSSRMAMDWQSFNIGAGHSVQFDQPLASAVALNRVIGADASTIQGALRANGQVFLLNPNGILFTPTAQVSVGSLVASTLKLGNEDFMAGRYLLSGSSPHAVINQGAITAVSGGSIALVAARIVNDGQLSAPGGSVLLEAGQQVTLDLGGPVQLQIDQAALDAQIANGGAIVAQGGQVLLSTRAAQALGSAVINQSGQIEASSLQGQGGSIRLSAEGGAIMQTGQLRAEGASGGAIAAQARAIIDAGQWSANGHSAQGGSIHLQAQQGLEQTAAARLDASGTRGGQIRLDGGTSAYLSGSSQAQGHAGTGGDVSATAQALTLAGAQLRADGSLGGGRIRVGGGGQGDDADLRHAAQTTVTASTQLSASAQERGQGGTVVVWSDQGTGVAAQIAARGGAHGGNGGQVETSSKGALAFAAQVDVTALQGRAGQILLDSKNLTISNQPSSSSYSVTPLGYAGAQPGDQYGSGQSVELSNGHVVVASPSDNLVASKAGAVRLYQPDGTLLATLTGGQALDQVGSQGVTALGNGNYVVASSQWANGAATHAGAVTWGSGKAGVSGVVNSANSLVGSQQNDQVGSGGVTALGNGSYVVASTEWANGAATHAGAVTWGSGAAGVNGAVSSANSLVGSQQGDGVGSDGVTALGNGNYVVASTQWANGAATHAGAVSWGSGAAGVSGAVSSANSLVGTQQNDQVGSGGVTALGNGNYVVASTQWANGAATHAGAVTWGSGKAGVSGAVSSANSLVGSQQGDGVGSDGVTALTNGNYVVASGTWAQGAAPWIGAVTWGNGTAGVSGTVSSANSLVGSQVSDRVGIGRVTALSNGNYVVASPYWYNGTVGHAGAVTWGNGATGLSGVVNGTNSLVGTQVNDQVGIYGVTALSNGNYVVASPYWANGAAAYAGAVTWGNGTAGISGVVNSTNSLVGSQVNDRVGGGRLTLLSNGNYVVTSDNWANGAATYAGAVTWGSGTAGVNGVVSSSNSLVGSQVADHVGVNGVTVLSNGNYVVNSFFWNNGAAAKAGAVTWGSGTAGVSGAVSSTNSLVGSQADDRVGSGSVTQLSNGNYVVASPFWANAAATRAGAVTWANGTAGVSGAVSSTNSLVGTQPYDRVGAHGVASLSNGNYVVASGVWGNGAATGAGAVTWANGTAGVSGAVSSTNSLVGSQVNDWVGVQGVTALSDGNYAVASGNWANGAATAAGAVTWGNGMTGINGVVGGANSQVGSQVNDQLGIHGVTALSNGAAVVISPYHANGTGRVDILSGPGPMPSLPYALEPGADYAVHVKSPADWLATGADVTLQASNDITLNSVLTVDNTAGQGGKLTLQAGRSVLLNAHLVTDDADLTVIANDRADHDVVSAHRDPGAGGILQAAGTHIDAGTGSVRLIVDNGLGVEHAQAGTITLATVRAADLRMDSAALSAQLDATDKVYDGNTTAHATVQLSGLVFQEESNLRMSEVMAHWNGKNVGTGKTVTAAALQITGFNGQRSSDLHQAGQALIPTGQADITPRALTVTATADNKVYDGHTAAITRLADDRVANDQLTLASAGGQFEDRNAGTGKTVTVAGITLEGADAYNYTFNQSASTTADITLRALAIQASKVADGSNRFEAAQLAVGNVVPGDQVSLSGSMQVASADPGRYDAFSAAGLRTDNPNYRIEGGQIDVRIVAQASQPSQPSQPSPESEAPRPTPFTQLLFARPAPDWTSSALNLCIESDGRKPAQLETLR